MTITRKQVGEIREAISEIEAVVGTDEMHTPGFHLTCQEVCGMLENYIILLESQDED